MIFDEMEHPEPHEARYEPIGNSLVAHCMIVPQDAIGTVLIGRNDKPFAVSIEALGHVPWAPIPVRLIFALEPRIARAFAASMLNSADAIDGKEPIVFDVGVYEDVLTNTHVPVIDKPRWRLKWKR